MRCSKCHQRLVVGAKFCHNCGAEMTPEEIAKNAHWYHEPVFVLLMIFLFLAIFGLPLLWKSPRFTEWQKVVISIITVAYTGAILWTFYYLVFVVLIPYYNQLMGVL
jgi:hypothetical protein